MEALQTLVFVGFYAGRAEFWEDARRQFARVAPELPETLALLDGAFGDPARADASVLRRLDAALDSLQFTSDPVRITRVAAAGAYLDRMRRARDSLWRGRRRRSSRRRRREGDRIPLPARERRLLHGPVGRARKVTADGLRLCEELGYALTASPGTLMRALVDAARGQDAAADQAAEDLLIWAAPRRLYTLAAYASHIR